MAVDSNLFTSATSHTVNGAKRNKDQFWKMWQQKYPDTLSQENLVRIQMREAPLVDKIWTKYFPEHINFLDDKLIHHHIDHGPLTTGLPKVLHETEPMRSALHHNIGGSKKK